MDVIVIIFFMFAIACAIFSLNSRTRIEAIISLMMMTIFISILFLYVNANFVAIFQLLVYSGVLTVLFASSSYFLEQGDAAMIRQNHDEVIELG